MTFQIKLCLVTLTAWQSNHIIFYAYLFRVVFLFESKACWILQYFTASLLSNNYRYSGTPQNRNLSKPEFPRNQTIG